MATELAIARQVPLAQRTTLQLGGPAEYLCEATQPAQVAAALDWAAARDLPVTLLAGGSNTVVSDAGVPGLTLVLALKGVTYAASGGDAVVTAMAGEPFEPLVAQAVARDLGGIECLSGIPGSVGATPVQNVGAYGQEVADVIDRVTAFDRKRHATVTMAPPECGFAYRNSVFKGDPGRFVVLSVAYRLVPNAPPCLRYAELARAVEGVEGPADPSVTLQATRRAVLGLRASKSMLVDTGDANHRSVGSFFTNPIVSVQVAERLVAQALSSGLVDRPEAVPCYPLDDGRSKLSAAWLIDRAGVQRGYRRGAVGVSSRHTLALVHHGGGTTKALCALAAEIRDRVAQRFGIALAPEPVFVGFADPPL